MTVKKEKLYATISKIKSLPTLPDILIQVSELLENPDTSASDINKVISRDMALASRVLKLSNSAFYGFPSEISSITHAVAVLGFDTLKTLLLTASVFDLFSMQESSRKGFDREKLWEHSLGVAVASTVIGKYINSKNVAELFTGGLLHDIGKVLLDHYLPGEFDMVLRLVREKNLIMLEAEEQAIGMNHADLGGYLVDMWHLPKKLQAMIELHHFLPHQVAALHSEDAAIVHLADILVRAKQIGSGGDGGIPEISSQAWSLLDLKLGDLETILLHIDEEYRKASHFLRK